ncbi:MAG: SUMF1/EgtB/PvdO family nonheme iron enzyme [Candidatus Latescibacteria bacterium]|nr:SUMF1/EgtB/PvdO family nonheme iron enzyme [Candidatus Latescibacterota bacterium]
MFQRALIALIAALSHSAAAEQRELSAYLPGGALMDFVWIEPGTFTMGSPPQTEALLRPQGWWDAQFADERPTQTTTITQGFYLGKYEITQRQWRAVTGKAPWASYGDAPDSSPAVCISWHDVQDFVQRLNAAQGDSLYRLPTEAEWEYACRAGTTTAWSFGDDPAPLADYAWYYDNAWQNGARLPLPVGTRRPNPWGLYDMYGNVWEWCQDWYTQYAGDYFVGPTPLLRGHFRVMRGGSLNSTRYLRSAARSSSEPNLRYNILIGARLVRRR